MSEHREREWWASAPQEAKWHTWDSCGKTWWAKRPACNNSDGVWMWRGDCDESAPWHDWYDTTPLPVEIDSHTTLRKRPAPRAGKE